MRTRARRELLLLRARTPVASGGGTETVALNAGTVTAGTLVGASLSAAMGDGSDVTRVSGTNTQTSSGGGSEAYLLTSVGFADLVGTGNVISFVVNVRVSTTGSANYTYASGFSGIVTAPSSSSRQGTSTLTNYTIGPFTKFGGGSWSAATFNAMTCSVIENSQSGGGGGISTITECSLTATFA